MIVSKHVEEFLSYLVETGRKPRTVEAYKGRLTELVHLAGSVPIEKVKADHLASIVKPDDTSCNKRRSEHTTAMRVQALKTFFQFCANKGYIPVSPAKSLTRPTRAKPAQEMPADFHLADPSPANMAIMPAGDILSLADEFLFFLDAQGRRAATVKIYRLRLKPLVEFFIGWKLDQITPRAIDQYIASLRGRFAPAWHSSHVQTTKTFFKFCASRGYISRSPADHLKRAKVEHINPDKVISQTSLESMIHYAKENHLVLDECLLLFLADTGCRVGELCSMNLEGLDMIHMEATVNGKTGMRPIYFTDPTAAALRSWLDARPATDQHAVFTTREGRISQSSIYHRLQRIARLLGITRFNPQSIRHRVGQAWVDRGVNLELIRIKLGHRDVTTTAKFYTHQDKERAKNATRKYSVILGIA